MLAPLPEQWMVLPSPVLCLLCCLLRIYHLCWVSIRLYFVSTGQSLLGWIVHCQHSVIVYMRPVLSLHYCHHKVLCMSSLCCTTASTECYVCFVRVALLPAQGATYVCLVCVALLPAQGAIYVLFVLHYCKRSMPLLNTASAVCRRWTQPVQCATVEHCQCSVPLLNTASTVSHAGAMISPLFIFIFTLFIIFTHSH